jgi:hypothetical protein
LTLTGALIVSLVPTGASLTGLTITAVETIAVSLPPPATPSPSTSVITTCRVSVLGSIVSVLR